MAEPRELREGVSVLVPVYRSQGHLAKLADRVGAVLDAASVPYELVLVDDGSDDGTWEEVRALATAGGSVRGLRLSRNYGQHNALLAGVRAVERERVVTLDDDLQYRPESIPLLLEAMNNGADLVYGQAERLRHGAIRGLVTRASKRLMRIATGEPMIASISALRAFRTELRTAFEGFDGPYVSLDALLLWSTNRVAEVPVPHDARTHGRSGYSVRSLMRHALTIMVGFSSRPLRAASVLGFACTALGIGLLAYVLVRYVAEGDSVPGFPFLASAISIFSGAQLFAIGVIGEYLARMYPRVMGRPSYSVAERIGA
ncbi:MAG TPA: glycosyltransferase family 2 protein [Solirubrobacterales bacterium]|nr:glycosyltransferase family 2 protein [Solirubrobacterales bacterium]